jgi:hypothetical protein
MITGAPLAASCAVAALIAGLLKMTLYMVEERDGQRVDDA